MILVTGGTGLVGCHLLYQLVLENKKVNALHRINSKIEVVKKVFSFYSKDFNKALALFIVSLYSFIGLLSATIPAPAWT